MTGECDEAHPSYYLGYYGNKGGSELQIDEERTKEEKAKKIAIHHHAESTPAFTKVEPGCELEVTLDGTKHETQLNYWLEFLKEVRLCSFPVFTEAIT